MLALQRTATTLTAPVSIDHLVLREVVQLLSYRWRSSYRITSPRRGEVGRGSGRVGPFLWR